MLETVPRRLRTNALLAFSGTVAFSLGQWALLVILARIGNTSLVGSYALGLAITTPIIMLASLGLRTVLVTDPQMPKNFGIYLGLRLALLTVGLGLMIAICILKPPLGAVGAIVAGAKSIDALADLYFGLQQRAHDLFPVACAQALNGLGTPLAVLSLHHLGASFSGALSASIGVSILATAYSIASTWKMGLSSVEHHKRSLPRPKLERKRTLALLRLAAPIGIASAVTAVLANLPRYALASSDGASALGIFMAISSVTLAGLTVVSAIAQALLPRLVETHRRSGSQALDRQVMRYVVTSLLIAAPLTLIAFLAGAPLLGLIFGPEYQLRGPFVILTLGLGLASASWLVETGLASKQRFMQQLLASVITLAVGIPAAWAMTHLWHITGAAWATLTIAATHLVVRLLLLRTKDDRAGYS